MCEKAVYNIMYLIKIRTKDDAAMTPTEKSLLYSEMWRFFEDVCMEPVEIDIKWAEPPPEREVHGK